MFDEILYPTDKEENEVAKKQNSHRFGRLIILGLISIFVIVMVVLSVFLGE